MCRSHGLNDGQKSRPQAGMTRRTLLRGSVASFGLAAGGVLFSAGSARAADLYNPFSGYPMTDGWWDHINRGSLGGIDYAMGVGTGLPAAGPER